MDRWDPASDLTAKPPQPTRVATSPLALPLRSSPNRSPPRSTISPNSSQSSLYLSPPLTDSESEEAPYKPNVGDRVSLDMHNTRKRRRKSGPRHNRQPLASVGRDRPSNQLWPIKKLHPNRPQTTSLTSGGSLSEDSGPFESKNIRFNFRKPVQTRRTISVPSRKGSPEAPQNTDPSRPRGSTMSKVQSWRHNDAKRSTDIPKTRRRWTLIGDSLPPSTSFLTAITRRRPSEDKAELLAYTWFNGTAKPPPPIRKDSTRRNPAFREGSRRRRSSQGQRFDTPATITLRKASNIYHCERAPSKPDQLANPAHQSQTNASSTLLSSYSGSIEPADQSLSRRSVPIVSNTSVIKDESSSARTCTLATIPGEPHDRALIRRPTMAADTALTFTEVHTSPKVFPSAGSSSRKHSLLAIEMMRRSSVVQVRSGGSIHEIIWDKDDTPSTRSSHSHDTLSPNVEPATTRSNSDGEANTLGVSDLGPHNSNRSESDYFRDLTVEGQLFSTSDEPQLPEKLIGWSWERVDAGISSNSRPSMVKEEEPAPPAVSTRSRPKRGRGSKIWDSAPILGIESFPPLLDRNSTHDWRRAPLVDINDPIAGREAVESNPYTPAPNDAKDETQPQTSNQTGLESFSKSRKPSRVGEAIGISHGHRRPSAAPTQQRPYKSLVDFSKSVSRKASTIGSSFSDLALSSRAGGSGSSKASKENPFEDLPPNPIIWGAEGLSVVPQWRKNSSSGLRINTMIPQPLPRLIEIAGSHSEEAE